MMFNFIVSSFNLIVEVWIFWEVKKIRCLGYFRMLPQKADMNPRTPLAGSAVCLSISNRAFEVLLRPGSGQTAV